jgi:hypothetical protein
MSDIIGELPLLLRLVDNVALLDLLASFAHLVASGRAAGRR